MNGLLKTLVKPDWDDTPKRSEILNAANLLQIGEFQLLQLAYKVWYRKELSEDKVDRIFSEYMFDGIIPIWATYYAKDIIKLDEAKVLNINDKKYHVYDNEFGAYIHNERQRKKRGIVVAIIIVLVFVFTHYMAANHFEEPAGFFPPYVEKSVVYPVLYKVKKNSN